jgi:hypothetical protein
MAKAPTPGIGKHREQNAAAQMVVTITIRDDTKRIAPFNLPLGESLAVRKATGGLSIESFWSGSQAIGADSVKMLWWLARRAEGEHRLTLDEVWDQWPDDLGPDELIVEVEEAKGDDPEV